MAEDRQAALQEAKAKGLVKQSLEEDASASVSDVWGEERECAGMTCMLSCVSRW